MYIIQINIRPVLFSPGRQRAKIKRGEFQCFKLYLFKHNSAWSNSRQGETICMCRRANITRGENNFCIQYIRIQKVPFLQVNETVSLTASKVRLKQEKPLKFNSNIFFNLKLHITNKIRHK